MRRGARRLLFLIGNDSPYYMRQEGKTVTQFSLQLNEAHADLLVNFLEYWEIRLFRKLNDPIPYRKSLKPIRKTSLF